MSHSGILGSCACHGVRVRVEYCRGIPPPPVASGTYGEAAAGPAAGWIRCEKFRWGWKSFGWGWGHCRGAGAKAGAASQPKMLGPHAPDEPETSEGDSTEPRGLPHPSAPAEATLRRGAVIYANDLLLHMGDNLQRSLQALRQHFAPCWGSWLSHLLLFLSSLVSSVAGTSRRVLGTTVPPGRCR